MARTSIHSAELSVCTVVATTYWSPGRPEAFHRRSDDLLRTHLAINRYGSLRGGALTPPPGGVHRNFLPQNSCEKGVASGLRGRIFPQVPAQIQCQNERGCLIQQDERRSWPGTPGRILTDVSLPFLRALVMPAPQDCTQRRGLAQCGVLHRSQTAQDRESMAGQQGWAGAHGSCKSSAPIIPIVTAPHAPPAASGRASTAAEGSKAAAARAHEHATAAAAAGRTSHEGASVCAMCAHARPPATAAMVHPHFAAGSLPLPLCPLSLVIPSRNLDPR